MVFLISRYIFKTHISILVVLTFCNDQHHQDNAVEPQSLTDISCDKCHVGTIAQGFTCTGCGYTNLRRTSIYVFLRNDISSSRQHPWTCSVNEQESSTLYSWTLRVMIYVKRIGQTPNKRNHACWFSLFFLADATRIVQPAQRALQEGAEESHEFLRHHAHRQDSQQVLQGHGRM